MRSITLDGSRRADLLAFGLASLTWAAAVAAGLWLLRSELPADLRRKKSEGASRVWQKAKPPKPWQPAKNRELSVFASALSGTRRQSASLRELQTKKTGPEGARFQICVMPTC